MGDIKKGYHHQFPPPRAHYIAKDVLVLTVGRHSALPLRTQDRSSKIRAHMERVSLSIKTEEVAARLKEER